MSIEDFEGKDEGPAFVYIEYVPGQEDEPVASGCQLFKVGTVLVPCEETPTAFKVVGVYDTFREAYVAHEALTGRGDVSCPS